MEKPLIEIINKAKLFAQKLDFIEADNISFHQLDLLLKKQLETRLLMKLYPNTNQKEITIKYNKKTQTYTIDNVTLSLKEIADMFEDEWIKILAENDGSFGYSIPMLEYFDCTDKYEKEFSNRDKKRQEEFDHNNLNKTPVGVESKALIDYLNDYYHPKKIHIESNENLIKRFILSPELVKMIQEQMNDENYITLEIKDGSHLRYKNINLTPTSYKLCESETHPWSIWNDIHYVFIPQQWFQSIKKHCFIYLYCKEKESGSEYFFKITSQNKKSVKFPILTVPLQNDKIKYITDPLF